MEKDTTYVVLGDSKRKVVVAILRPGATEPEQREMPKEPHHIQRLFRRLKREGPLQACYQVGVSGYDLYRQITDCGVPCQVIAPALTPHRPGQRVKTDCRGARKLVRLFRAGELTPIHAPDEAEEAVRDLMAYLGLVPSEYSSGGTQRRGAITKAGHPRAARARRGCLALSTPARPGSRVGEPERCSGSGWSGLLSDTDAGSSAG